MRRVIAYTHDSRIGPFLIRLQRNGRWRIEHDGENLGSAYVMAQSALDDLVGGHCDWPGVTDPSTLGLPDEISEWTALVADVR